MTTKYQGTIAGAVIGLVTATVSLLIALGIPMDQLLQDALIGEATAVVNVAPFIGAIIDHARINAKARVTAATATPFN